MTSSSVVVAVAFAVTAVLFFWCAYAIRVQGNLNLIAGYDPNFVRDPAGLGRWVGGGAFWLGCVTLAFALVQFFMPGNGVALAFGATLAIGSLESRLVLAATVSDCAGPKLKVAPFREADVVKSG